VSNAARLLRVERLQIEARSRRRLRTIVSRLDLEVGAGEAVAIVGESGSGKSLTARALLGLLPRGVHAAGTATSNGRNLLVEPERALRRVRGRDIALLLQDPFTMLNPLMRVGAQITETLEGDARAGTRGRQEAVRRLAEVGIRDAGVADRYPFQLSGGMRQRVAIAAALASNPRLLIADEPSTALDVTTQKEILALIRSIQAARGMGLILITHDLRVAFSMCERVYVLYAGSVLEEAPAEALESEPLHPYSLGLILSEPSLDRRSGELAAIEGSVPAPDDVAGRCAFSPRCRWAAPQCVAAAPPLRSLDGDRKTACVRIEEIRPELMQRLRAADAPSASTPARTTAEPLLRVEGLRKTFPGSARGGGGTVVALDDVTLEIGRGESVGVVGESGSGKTTFARCVVGLERPTAGRITVNGIDAGAQEELSAWVRRELRRSVQMIFQDPYSSLNPARSIDATLREALEAGEPGAGRSRGVRELLARVGLPASYADRRPRALSGGERQRVAIARALALRPKLLICDEPVSALDVSVQAQILNLFTSLREELGVAYMFITHDLAVVRQIVDRVVVLYRGSVVEEGPVDRVLEEPRHAYTAALIESVPRPGTDWLAGSGAGA
jgi:peptide/nickel transport system ATP-binding protein